MIAPTSAGPLRAKAGKTMPGCAAAGLLETLPEAWASAATGGNGSLPRFYLLCRAMADERKEA